MILICLFPIIVGNFSFTEKITVKYAGAAAMYFVAKKLKKKYNITDERAALYEAAETWVDALNGREFLGMHSSFPIHNFFKRTLAFITLFSQLMFMHRIQIFHYF